MGVRCDSWCRSRPRSLNLRTLGVAWLALERERVHGLLVECRERLQLLLDLPYGLEVVVRVLVLLDLGDDVVDHAALKEVDQAANVVGVLVDEGQVREVDATDEQRQQ